MDDRENLCPKGRNTSVFKNDSWQEALLLEVLMGALDYIQEVLTVAT